jgi:hypothetical protein
MIIDELGTVVMEQSGHPGNTGDSMAETSRLFILGDRRVNLHPFITEQGWVRHPNTPWREPDMSNDQLLPWVLATQLATTPYFNFNAYKIRGSSTWLQPGTICAMRGWYSMLNIINCLQGYALKCLPYRWSDSKKWFERTDDHSADYLNYTIVFLFLAQTNRPATLSIHPDLIMQKIKRYYRPEPNSEWVVQNYEKMLNIYA